MANINKIKISGSTYNIEDLNATRTIELSQAEYDALGTIDPNVFYVITDSDGVDVTDYYTKTEVDNALSGKVDTSAITTSLTSGSTDSQVPSAKVVYDQVGGLKLVSLTQSQYEDLQTKDDNTVYFVQEDVS